MSELYWALDYLRSRYGTVIAGQNDELARAAIEKLYERIDELEAQLKEDKE